MKRKTSVLRSINKKKMESGLKIQKLRDKDNWQQWQFVVRTLLEDDDLVLAVCEGTKKKPADSNENRDALAAWNKADKIARRLIVTTIESKPMELIMSLTTAHEMWNKLSTVYDNKSSENLSFVQKQFFDFVWLEGESVAHNLSKIEQLAAKLKALDSEVKESMLITRILSSLPKNFVYFHSAWDSVSEDKKTLENLTARLMAEELRMPTQGVFKKSAALIADAPVKKENQQNSFNDDKKKKCFNCGKPGHIKKKCFRCYHCKEKGHKSFNCPKRAQEVQKASNYAGKSDSGSRDQNYTAKVALMGSSDSHQGDEWVIDSGATDHMTKRRDWFSTYEEFAVPMKINLCDGNSVMAYGKGTIDFKSMSRDKHVTGSLNDVLFLPNIVHNLFSVKAAGRKGVDFYVRNNATECFFKRGEDVLIDGSEYGNLFRLNIEVLMPGKCCLMKVSESLRTWHERLCHQGVKHVESFLKSRDIAFLSEDFICEGCIYGKMHRLPFRVRKVRATRVREIIYSDVCGPMEVESISRKLYFVVFKDDFSGYRMIHFMRRKSEVFDKLVIVCEEIENRFSERIKELHSDGGGEYDNDRVISYLGSKGIKFSMNPPYTPEHNGVAERDNRIIVEAARSMLYSNPVLPKFLWAEAMNTAVYVINRTGPTKQGVKTPYELWHGAAPDIGNLKVFGTECFVHIPKEKRRKLSKKSERGYVVGYHGDNMGYRVYIPERRDVVVSRDVFFKPERVCPDVEIADILSESKYRQGELSDEVHQEVNDVGHDDLIGDIGDDSIERVEPPEVSNEGGPKLRDRSKLKRTDFYGDPVSYLAEVLPSDYKEVMVSEGKSKWEAAMRDEMRSLHENETWVLVDAPRDRKVIGNRWVFTKKVDTDGSERYKARLVAKGYSQREGIDYRETFSPVARFETVRFLLGVAASGNMILGQFDVKTAFLNGKLEEEIFMQQPEGFRDGTKRVCRLLKSLYGLKQSPRCWIEGFAFFIRGLGFSQSSADPCLYIYVNGEERVFLVIFVDDGLVAATHDYLITKLFRDLARKFEITSTMDVGNYLGIEISRLTDGSIFIGQGSYIKRVLSRFGMSDANSVCTPIECNWNDILDNNRKKCEAPYREAVGCLIYLQVVSRPDISFAVNVLSRDLEKPNEGHWVLLKRVLRYLKGTLNLGLLYGCTGNFITYSDADYAGDKLTRKSMSGVVCLYANAAVTWLCKKQSCIAQSTTEAEYISAAAAAKEIIWFRKLFDDCKLDIKNFLLCVDNTGAIRLTKNPEFHQRSKHIDVKYHFIRDLYNKKKLEISYVKSEDQIADIFTKALPKDSFISLVSKLGLRDKNNL